MKIYEIRKEIFFSIKHKLDGLIFWRETETSVQVKKATSQPGLTQFLEQISKA